MIVFIPLVTGVYAVEVPRLPRPVLVLPVVARWVWQALLDVEELLLLVELALCLRAIQRLGREVGVARRGFARLRRLDDRLSRACDVSGRGDRPALGELQTR